MYNGQSKSIYSFNIILIKSTNNVAKDIIVLNDPIKKQ